MENITIVVPAGSRDHSNPKLLCTPTQWTDIATFFLANYVAHAATVKSVPGESPMSVALTVIVALVFPTSGIIRALGATYQCAVFADTPLKTAARAKALCTVVRTSTWKPQTGDIVECLGFRTTEKTKDAVLHDPEFEFLDWKEAAVNDNRLWRLLMGHLPQSSKLLDRKKARANDSPFWRWSKGHVPLLSKLVEIRNKLIEQDRARFSKTFKMSSSSIDKAELKVPALMVKIFSQAGMEPYGEPFFVPSVSNRNVC